MAARSLRPAFAPGCSGRLLQLGACPSEAGAAGTAPADVKQSLIGAAFIIGGALFGPLADGFLGRRQDRRFAGDAAVMFREVTRDEVLAALGDGGEESVLRACVAALRAYSRPSCAIGGSPADALRETLEVKYRHGASLGKTFVGDGELLLRLQELGDEPVAVVSAHRAGENFYVYVIPSTLKPVGAVIMYDAPR